MLVSILPQFAFPCQGGENTPSSTLETALKKAEQVFFGQMFALKQETLNGKTVTNASVVPMILWKGEPGARILHFQTGRSCDVGKYAQEGGRWFIVAGTDGYISSAGHSRPLYKGFEKSESELHAKVTAVLGKYKSRFED